MSLQKIIHVELKMGPKTYKNSLALEVGFTIDLSGIEKMIKTSFSINKAVCKFWIDLLTKTYIFIV